MGLNSKEFAYLKAGLLPQGKGGGTGLLVGMTMAKIAQEFTARRALQGDTRTVGPRTINYYVGQIRKAGGSPNTRPRSAGRPPLDTPASTKLDLNVSLWREMLRLTGLKPIKLYDVLSEVFPGTLPSRSVFYANLNAPKWQGSEDGFSRPPSRSTVIDWLDRYCLRINAVILEGPNTQSYWVVLAGYESITGYLDLSILEVWLTDTPPVTNKLGRPRKPPEGPAKIFIQRQGGKLTFQLSSEILTAFFERMQRKLGLPIRRVEVNQSILSQEQAPSAQDVTTQEASAPSEAPHFCPYEVTPRQYLPYRVPDLLLDELRRFADIFLRHHCLQRVEQLVEAERSSLLEAFQKGIQAKRTLFMRQAPNHMKLSELVAYYQRKPPIFKAFSPTACTFDIVRGAILEHAEVSIS